MTSNDTLGEIGQRYWEGQSKGTLLQLCVEDGHMPMVQYLLYTRYKWTGRNSQGVFDAEDLCKCLDWAGDWCYTRREDKLPLIEALIELVPSYYDDLVRCLTVHLGTRVTAYLMDLMF
jgi:hypothetical protein